MATLILSAVGGAVAGPPGAAVGAVLGNAIDRKILSPKGRVQGARLSDLKVQTSSYGTPIPQVFGTMRVAGNVIWATELIETQNAVRGGKGRPGGTAYAYAASFAVALSARAIVAVGRIWADGKLLRGAAGDWKVPTGFRLYRGGEEQLPDPLIASLVSDAPAHRGLAYAVFENLPLAEFGNRIPSLTFEVIGDEAPPTIGAVARALGQGAIVGAGPGATVHGYAASGESVAAALETLATIAGAWWTPVGGALSLVDALTTAVPIEADAAVRDVRRPIETVPKRLALSCYDPERDFQIGVQQAVRPEGAGWREAALDLPAALPAAQARGVAQATVRRAEAGRVTRRVTLDAGAMGIAPGAAVRLSDASVWRVTRAAVEGQGVTLELTPVAAQARDAPADPGRMVAAPDLPPARTRLVVAELPPLDDARADVVRVAVFASGSRAGWRGAGLMVSGDGGASWEGAGVTAAPAVLGRLALPLAAGTDRLVERQTIVEVALAHDDMLLTTVSEAAFDRGGNLALIGAELFQFRAAARIGPGRWRLTGLLRGRRGTRAEAHDVDTPFVLVSDEAMATVALPRARFGETIRLLAQGSGDAEPVAAAVTLTGVSIAPPSPVRVRLTGNGTLAWVRRSRLGWRWADGGDVPLGEERESYAVTITGPDGERSSAIDAPGVALPPGATRVTVRQQGTLAASPPAVWMTAGEAG